MNRKIKVLNMPMGRAYGGITRYVLENWKYIDKERYQFDFITMLEELDYEEALVADGAKVYHMCRAEEDPIRFADQAEKILDTGYDVVHLHTSFWKGFNFEKCAKKKGVKKIIVHAHSTDISRIQDLNLLNEMRRRHFDVRSLIDIHTATDFWACSWEAAEWLYGDQIPKECIKIVDNGIEVDKFRFSPVTRKKYRKELGLEGKYVVGHVGRFCYSKNQDFLIEVFHDFQMKKNNAVLLLAGEGETKEKLMNRVKMLDLEDKVLFLGQRNDMEGIYQAMDVFVFPSKFEGFGRVLIEAQVSGLRCVASSYIPKSTCVTNNITYLPLDKKEWVKEWIKIGEYKREDLSDEVRRQGYDIKKSIKKLEKLYQEVSHVLN